jgi:CubicO group peptidase (beta-lactamase class C family)
MDRRRIRWTSRCASGDGEFFRGEVGPRRVIARGDPGSGALPLDGESVFEIGSMTKVFTGILVGRGEVELAHGLAELLPPHVRVPDRGGKPVTLLDLTTHFSGLPMMPTNLEPANPRNPFADYTTSHVDFLGFHLLDPTVPVLVEQQSDEGERCGSL